MLWANDDTDFSTGKFEETDTTVTVVPIAVLKEANVKLHERIILKDIVMTLEEKVKLYKKHNNKQAKEITQLQNELGDNRLALANEKEKSKYYKRIAIVEAITIVGTLIFMLVQ